VTPRSLFVRHLTRPQRRLIWLLVGVAIVACGAVLVRSDFFLPTAPRARPELQRVLDRLVTGRDRIAPGVTAYVANSHGTWVGSAGLANVTTVEPMRPDARMRLESVSKAWTATLILQLVGEGRMRLDDTVARWLPGLLPYGNRITVRELLNHTSGLIDSNDIGRDPMQYLSQVRDPALRGELLRVERRLIADPAFQFPALLWVRFAAALPLLSRPGTSYHYSNIGYKVAGMIAERVSGMPLPSLYERRIIEPLGLASAAFDPQGDITGPHASGYLVQANGKLIEATAWGTGGGGAEAAIVADAQDEARFLTALMQGRLLSPAQLAAMKTPASAIGSDYALGFVVEPSGCGGTVYQHNGGGAGFKTSVFVSGDGTRVAVLLLNGNTLDGRADTLAHAAADRLYCGG
jgi:D-alanyl-D-alanine carboxypeptidase